MAFESFDRARRENQHAMRRLAAENLLPAEGRRIQFREIEILREGGGRRVTDGEALSVGRDEVGIGHSNAGGRAVPGKDEIIAEIELREIRQLAVGRGQSPRMGYLELRKDVSRPVGGKTLPHGDV